MMLVTQLIIIMMMRHFLALLHQCDVGIQCNATGRGWWAH